MISSVKNLLNDEYLKEFSDSETAENVVQYMYRWKICSVRVFKKCEEYMNELFTLIDEDSEIYQFAKS